MAERRKRSRVSVAALAVAHSRSALLLLGAVMARPVLPAPERIGAARDRRERTCGGRAAGRVVCGTAGGGAVWMHGVRGTPGDAARARPACEGRAVDQAHGEARGSAHVGASKAWTLRSGRVLRQRLPNERIGAMAVAGRRRALGPAPRGDALVLDAHRRWARRSQPRPRGARADGRRVARGRPPGCSRRSSAVPRDTPGAASADRPYRTGHGAGDDRIRHARHAHHHGRNQNVSDRAPEPKLLWAVEGAGHVDLEGYGPDAYRAGSVAFWPRGCAFP